MKQSKTGAEPAEQPVRPPLTPVQAVALVAFFVVVASVLVLLLDPVQAWTVGFLTAGFVLTVLGVLHPPKDPAQYVVDLFRPKRPRRRK